MRRWGTPQNFYLVFIDELGKQLFIKKTVEVAIKCKNFNIYYVFKNKKNKQRRPGNIIILHLCTKNLDDMI